MDYENQLNALSDRVKTLGYLIRKNDAPYSTLIAMRTERGELLNQIRNLKPDNRYCVSVETNGQIIDKSLYSFQSNAKHGDRLAIMFANHFGTPEPFDGCGGRMEKPDWIKFHENRTGVCIGDTVEVRGYDGKIIHTVKVCRN